MKPRPQILASSLLLLAVSLGIWLSNSAQDTPQATTAAPNYVVPTPPPEVVAAPSLPVKAEPETPPVQFFAKWVETYRLAEPAARPQLEAEGVKLAEARQEQVYNLIKEDPKAAIEAAVTEGERRLLPERITRLLERPINARGELALVAATPLPGQARLIKRPMFREARLGTETLDAYVYGERAKQDTKYDTSIQGIAVKDRIAVLDAPSRIFARAELPADLKLEPGIALEGDPVPTAISATVPVVQARGKSYPVCCAAHAAALASQIAYAESHPGTVVDALGGSESTTEAGPSSLAVTGAQSVLVILTSFSDFTAGPIDPATSATVTATALTNRITNDVSDFLNQASYSKLSISSVSVTNVLRLPDTLTSYSTTDNSAKLKSDALTAAKTAGFTTANYDHVVVMFPGTHGIPSDKFLWTGLADVGGNFVWLNGDFTLGVVAHELGHNYGMRHANIWRIPGASTNPIDPAGHSEEYGDPFDIMGSGPSDSATQPDFPNPWALNRIHWLADSAVNTISSSGTYRIYRYDHKDAVQANTLALKLQRTASTDYWLGYRRKYVSHATHSDVSNGAYIFWGYHDNVASNLIDIDTPGSNDLDASLNVGSTFNDSAAGVSFQVTAAGGSGTAEYLDIAVNFQPRLVFNSKQSVDEQAGHIDITIARQNNALGAVGVHYATANGTATAGSDYTTTSGDLTWADGDSTPKIISIPITADAVVEGAETFNVNLTAFTGGAVAPDGNTITVTIQEPGAEDTQFIATADFNSGATSMIVRPDGRIVVAGYFDDRLALLNTDGSRDTTFDKGPGPNIIVPTLNPPKIVLARQADGKILIGSKFTTLRDFACNNLARLNEDGNFDTTFSVGSGPNDAVTEIQIQPDGKILVGGSFTTWNGTAHAGLVRLNEDGSLDATLGNLDAIVDSLGVGYPIQVNSIALQPTAVAPFFRIIAGGQFNRPFSNGGFHCGIVALNAIDGTRDTSFDSPIGANILSGSTTYLSIVSSVAVQPDGKILVGGQFNKFNGASAGHLVRLNNTGLNDNTFSGGLNGSDLTGIFVQADGKILVTGSFSSASGTPQIGLARYTAAGAFDTTFRPATNSSGFTVAMQSDATILASFNSAGGPNVLRRFFSSQAQPLSLIQFTSTSTSATEGSAATLTVQRTGGTLGAVSVNYSTIPRSATADSDYTSTNGTLTWAAGDNAPKTISVPVLSDLANPEPDETFEVRLGAPVGGVLFGDNQTANVTIIGVDPATVPHIQFASSGTTASESAGSVNITLTSSLAPVSPITVPITVSGTATHGTDFTVSASSVTFGIGEMSKDVTLSIIQDSALETTNETVLLTLGSPSGLAMLGTQKTFTATIVDDEAIPAIASGLDQPQSHIAALNGSTTFTVTATGNPMPNSYQWRKVTTNIGTASTSNQLTLSNLALTSAGLYNVIIKSPISPAAGLTSNNATLGVLDTGDKTINGVAGGNATLTAYCSTNITGFQWYKNHVPVSNVPGHISGATTKSLAITKLVNSPVSDADTYTCVVTLPGAASTMSTGTYTLNVLDTKPDITDTFTLDEAVIGGYYEKQVTFDKAQNRTPTSFSASPLPHGLSISATGKISGTPDEALLNDKPYTVVIKATNANGYDTRTTTLLLHALPTGSVGTFVGPINRSTTISGNGDQGGRFDLTTLSTGIFSGQLVNGTTLHKFTAGKLTASVNDKFPTGHIVIPRTNLSNLVVDFTIDADNNKLSALTLTDGTGSATGEAWRNVPLATGDKFLDLHTLGMKLATPNSSLPQGTSYASFTVPLSGKFTLTGKLANGAGISTAGHISTDGKVLIHQYSTTAENLVGTLQLVTGSDDKYSDYSLSGTVTWTHKQQAATSYTYRNAFGPTDLTAFGSRYYKPKTTPLPAENTMGLAYVPLSTTKNAKVTFTNADFGSTATAPDAELLIPPTGKPTVIADSNPRRTTTFSVTPSTGFFTGSVSLIDLNPVTNRDTTRTATYQGLIVRDATGIITGKTGLSGQGYVLLPNVPAMLPDVVGKMPFQSANVSLEALQ